MTERLPGPDSDARHDSPSELPPPDVTAFIRYCHRRRGFTWPELYDEMCGVAARREFNGWDQGQLAAIGINFSLSEMPRLSGWSRAVLAREEAPIPASTRAVTLQALKAAPA
ncbi:hypothetical protein BH20CHL8_BH20CHL8_11440 [soil metagenome]